MTTEYKYQKYFDQIDLQGDYLCYQLFNLIDGAAVRDKDFDVTEFLKECVDIFDGIGFYHELTGLMHDYSLCPIGTFTKAYTANNLSTDKKPISYNTYLLNHEALKKPPKLL